MNLLELITADPDAAGYGAMNNQQVAADINDKRHAIRQRVPFGEFEQFLFDNGVVLAVFTAKNDPAHAAHAVATLADQLMAFGAERLSKGIDLDSAGNDALLDAMVSLNLMSAQVRATMEMLGDGFESLANQNGLGHVTAGMVQAARSN